MNGSRFQVSRRSVLRGAAAAAGALLVPGALPLVGCGDELSQRRYFRFAILSDSHVIDEYYVGPESNRLDTESILSANERFARAVTFVEELEPRMDFVLLGGDIIHRYPFADLDAYAVNRTAIDEVAEQLGRLSMPVHATLGNHDYAVRSIERSFTHELFREKLGIEPYTSFDFMGWRFIMANCYLGATQDRRSDAFDTLYGSYGREQLEWMEALLEDGLPTFIVTHQPPLLLQVGELGDFGFLELVRRYQDTIVEVITGHWHRWFDFGTTYGPHVMAMGSTRYDEDAVLLVEVDTLLGTARFVNRWTWFTHETPPFDPATAAWGRG